MPKRGLLIGLFLAVLPLLSFSPGLRPEALVSLEAGSAPGFDSSEPVLVSPSRLPLGGTRMLQGTANQFEPEIVEREERTMQKLAPMFTPQHFLQRDTTTSSFQPFHMLGNETGAAAQVRFVFDGPVPIAHRPDCNLAVGPGSVLVTTNDGIFIYDKTGHKRFQASLPDWFSPLNRITGGASIFDPRIIYDQYAHRYLFVCTTRRPDRRSWLVLSVSSTANPLDPWAYYALDMQINGTTRSQLWADFPRVGMDQKAVYLTADMSRFGTFTFAYAKIRVLPKATLYALRKATWHDFWGMKDATGAYAYCIEPVQSYGPALKEYMVNINPVEGNKLTLWTITDPGTPQVKLVKQGITVSSYQVSPLAVQKGGGARLLTGDATTFRAVYRFGTIFTSFSTAFDWGSGEASAIRYEHISPQGRILQETTLGADRVYYYYPAVMPDNRGDLVMVFNRSSATEYPSIYYTTNPVGTPPGNFQGTTRLQAGKANFEVVFPGTGVAHWGDYNGITWDPDGTVWIFSQYSVSSDEYRFKIAKIGF